MSSDTGLHRCAVAPTLLWSAWGSRRLSHFRFGWVMRRVIVIAVAGLSLAGCSSLSWDSFRSAPPIVQVRLELVPPGADAVTTLGPSCKTPCSVGVSATDNGFSVTYTMNRFQPATVPVQVVHVPGDLTTSGSTRVDPNPVVAELQAMGPPPRAARKVHRPRKPRPPKDAAAPAAAESPFPEPAQAAAPGPAPAVPAAPPAPPPAH